MREHKDMRAGALGGQRYQLSLELELQWLWAAERVCWKLSLDPLQELQEPLTAEPSIHPHTVCFLTGIECFFKISKSECIQYKK